MIHYALILYAGATDINLLYTLIANVVVCLMFRKLYSHLPCSKRPDGTGNGYPSGHSMIVTAFALYTNHHLAYTLAIVTYLQRIESKRHTHAQVLAGIIFAYAVSLFFKRP